MAKRDDGKMFSYKLKRMTPSERQAFYDEMSEIKEEDLDDDEPANKTR